MPLLILAALFVVLVIAVLVYRSGVRKRKPAKRLPSYLEPVKRRRRR
jgi:hypothetical protein